VIGKFVARLGEARTALLGWRSVSVGSRGTDSLRTICGFWLRFLISLWGIAKFADAVAHDEARWRIRQGQLQGAIASLYGIGGMIGPLLFTGIFATAISNGREFGQGLRFGLRRRARVAFMIAWAGTRNCAQYR